jgi:hypothetical protein
MKINSLFNSQLKEEFLKLYPENTARTYAYDLAKISESERFYNKDIFNFTYEQLEDALKSLQAKSYGSISRMISTISQYYFWANNKGLVSTKIDYSDLFFEDKISSYVWTHAIKHAYVSREEMYDICDKFVNAIDRATAILPFEGIKGEELSEMINLKYSDINFNTGETILTDLHGNTRQIIITNKRTFDILKEAQSQDVYLKKNGNAIGKTTTSVIIDSPYVIKKTINLNPDNLKGTEYSEDEKVTAGYLEAKFTRFFKDKYNSRGQVINEAFINLPFLNINNIFKSGFFEFCHNLEIEKGVLSTNDYLSICQRYGIKTDRWATYKFQYIKWKQNNL